MNFRTYYKYLSSRIASKWVVLSVDVIIVVISILSACFLQYRLSSVSYEISLYVWLTIWAVLCNVCFFHIFRTYVGVIRFSSFVDIYRVFWSLTISYVVLFLGNFCWSVLGLEETLPNSILFMAYMFTFSLMVCMRIAVKMLYEAIAFDARHCVNVFIYGFHGTGVDVAKSLRVSRNNHYRLRGFISDELDMIGKHTMGCRVYPNDEQLFDRLKKKKVDTIIISPSKVSDLENSGMLDKLFSHDIHVMTVPPLSDCMDDGLIKDIQIEDWLRGEPVQVDMRKIAAHIEGRRVMVTGAAGAVGREIVRQLATLNPYQLILVDQAESPLYDVQLELSDHWKNLEVRVLVADVANRTRMEAIFEGTRPQLVFHSAAYKHVQLMDDFVSEAIQTNISGTVNIADLAVKYRVSRMVMMSVTNARHPENAMEYSKRVAEMYVQSSYCRLKRDKGETDMFIVRLSEMYPMNAHCLMTLSEACMLTLEVGVMGDGGEVYIVGGPGDGLLDSVISEKIKREKASVDDYEHVREEVLALVQHSYTEKKAILIGLMKKIVPIFSLSSTQGKDVKMTAF